jgi:O-antigen ligase
MSVGAHETARVAGLQSALAGWPQGAGTVAIGGLALAYDRYATPQARENTHFHNTYLQLLAGRGPTATAAWSLLLGWGLARALRSARRLDPTVRPLSIAVGLVLAVVVVAFEYVWEDWRLRSLFLAFLGLAWCPALAPRMTLRGEGVPS